MTISTNIFEKANLILMLFFSVLGIIYSITDNWAEGTLIWMGALIIARMILFQDELEEIQKLLKRRIK